MAKIDKFLKAVREYEGSDLHILSGTVPKIRIHGQLQPLEMPPMSNKQATGLLLEILSDSQKIRFLQKFDIDFAYQVADVARFRVNFFMQRQGIGGVFRLIPTEIKPLAELGIPVVVERFAELRSGLVLVTGPTGSGKSTTLAALLDYINRNYSKHIITIEDPIEYVHTNKKSVITQRELWHDTNSFADALRAAGREDPDVVLVGEMRDLETISLAVSLAETGLLVFATLHTNHAAKTVDRIIDVFPTEQQPQIRAMLSFSLKGVLSQLLIPRKDRKGRIPVCEVLFATTGLPNIIREGRTEKIATVIEGGRGMGMQRMDDSIIQACRSDQVDVREAYIKAIDKQRFAALMKQAGLETY
jgi:twitching motility protein PilT